MAKRYNKRRNRRGRKSVMQHSFSQVPQASIQRSRFNRSHGHKTTFDEGYLIPILVDEVLPGDTFNVRMTAFARLATPIFPIMDNLKMDTHFFAVPNRLVWENWQRFNGEQDDPDNEFIAEYEIPHFVPDDGANGLQGTIYDYMGIPIKNRVDSEGISSLHLRAYNLIYNEWFRDQNLQDSVRVNKADDGDLTTDFKLLRRGKRHDYFTSCLPWPQKGKDVILPLGTSAPVNSFSHQHSAGDYRVSGTTGVNVKSGAAVTTGVPPLSSRIGVYATSISGQAMLDYSTTHDTIHFSDDEVAVEANKLYVDVPGDVVFSESGSETITTATVNLSEATSATINELRRAFQIQKLLERDARGGTRYTEIVKSHFGVTSPDARLQRPEYLGGGSQSIIVTPIGQTSESNNTPQGNLAAIGTGVVNGNGFSKSFTEHCLIIGLVSVRADLTYQEGLNRMWSRRTRYDYYWPSLSHIGEQSVFKKEIQSTNVVASNEEVFGYQERYAEYRYKPSMITGKFRSYADGTLDAWHLSQKFSTVPTLGSDFIEEKPPVGRTVAVAVGEPHFIMDVFFDMYCTRPMPVYAVPGKIDHF